MWFLILAWSQYIPIWEYVKYIYAFESQLRDVKLVRPIDFRMKSTLRGVRLMVLSRIPSSQILFFNSKKEYPENAAS
jgi:hypothetical protein